MTTTIRPALLAVVLALAAPAIAQTEMIVQIEANGEVITAGEGNGTVIGGVDASDYAFVLNYSWTGEATLDATCPSPPAVDPGNGI